MTTSGDPARLRRRLMMAIALGLLLVLPCAVALQAGLAEQRTLPLLGIALGTMLALAGSLGLTALQLHAFARPALGQMLDDELAARNSLRAMAIGYVAAIGTGGLALPLAAWLAFPAVPVLTAVVLVAVVAHAASFAWLERQGDDGADD